MKTRRREFLANSLGSVAAKYLYAMDQLVNEGAHEPDR